MMLNLSSAKIVRKTARPIRRAYCLLALAILSLCAFAVMEPAVAAALALTLGLSAGLLRAVRRFLRDYEAVPATSAQSDLAAYLKKPE